MRTIYLHLLLIIALASCGGEQSAPEPTVMPQPEIVAVENPNPEAEKGQLDPEIAPYLPLLDSIYSSAPLWFKDGDEYYFYVVLGDWPAFWERNRVDGHKYVIGIVRGNNETILPPIYDKIYAPDATAKGYIEIETNGKRGLVNYHTKQLIPARYDVIFPTNDSLAVAVGKRGNNHYYLRSNGTEALITDATKIPRYANLGDALNYDVLNGKWRLLTDSYAIFYTDNGTVYDSYAQWVAIPPSYLLATGFTREYIDQIDTGGYPDPALTASRNKIENSRNIFTGMDALISAFYEEGADARGFFAREKHLALIDSNNNVLDHRMIHAEQYAYAEICGWDSIPYRFVNDSLIEVKTISGGYLVHQKLYYGMPNYSYFSIAQTGKITLLKTYRLFSFTKYVIIDESYFKGCFVQAKYDDDSRKWPNDDQINAIATDHLTVNDLDIMRNEIFAEYGLKFKDDNWDSYFRELSWYRPRYDNIDNQLTEIDKANLAVIKQVREKLLKNPKKYLNERYTYYYPGA